MAFSHSNTDDSMDSFSLSIEDGMNSTTSNIQPRIISQLELQFREPIARKIFARAEIKAENGAAMQVALMDVSTRKVAVSEPESSASVELVLLKGETGDWTAEEFDENIVRDTEGKKPLLEGNTRVKLHNGVAEFKSIKLTHKAQNVIDPPVFHLGAIFVDRADRDRIKAAKTGSFTVRNYRGQYYEKHDIPALATEVHRLANISKGGKIHKRLQNNGIETVEDFLICLWVDPQGLQKISQMKGKKWSDAVTNARACREKRVYCYTDSEHNTRKEFSILDTQAVATTNLASVSHKAEADGEIILPPASTYASWKKGVKRFDNDSALPENLAGLPINRRKTVEISINDFDIVPDGAEVFFVISQDVPNRRWNVLHFVSRWFCVIKKFGGSFRPRKKQRVANMCGCK